jgi:hypothetical protein
MGAFLESIPLPGWIPIAALTLIAAAEIVDSSSSVLRAVVGAFRALSGLPLAGRHPTDVQRRAAKRRNFAIETTRGISLLEYREQWSDRQFTDLQARVETERSSPFQASLLRFFSVGRQLRVANSISRALNRSQEPLILLQGDPGSGKSVALRHIALHLATKASHSRRVNSLIPLYINLKGLRRDPNDGVVPIIDPNLIQGYVDRTLRVGGTVTLDRFLDEEFEDSVEEGTFLFLFDSFDEIPEILASRELDETILQYSEAIAGFLHGMRRCRGIVASREFRSPEGLAWPVWRILPLDARRRERLIHKSLLDRANEGTLLVGLQSADPDVVELSSNPLFLQLLCSYVHTHTRFPPSMHVAIEDYMTQRLTRDQERLRQRFQMDPGEVRSIAQAAAFCMSAEPALTLEPDERSLIDALQARGLSDGGRLRLGLRALEWVKLAQTTELAAPGAGQSFTFAHRRFQEYFATAAVIAGIGSVAVEDLVTQWRWRDTAVTLLQLQRENAQELLATAARLLRSASRRYGTILPEQFNSLLEGRIDESQLTLRPWPAQVHHILGLIQSGVGGEIGRLPGGLRMVAGSLLAKAYVTGDTLQQKQALEVAAVAPDGVFAGITRAAFNGSSEWLRDTAYRQAARLHSLTPDVEGGIRVLLGRMSVDRRLWPERVTVHAQISRLGSTSLNRAFYLTLTARLADWAVNAAAISLLLTLPGIAPLVRAAGLVAAGSSVILLPRTVRALLRVWTSGLPARVGATRGWAAAWVLLSFIARLAIVFCLAIPANLRIDWPMAAVAAYGLSWAPAAYFAAARARSLPWYYLLVGQLAVAADLFRRARSVSPSVVIRYGGIAALYVTGCAFTLSLVGHWLLSPGRGAATTIIVAGLSVLGCNLGVGAILLTVSFFKTTVRDVVWYRSWRRSHRPQLDGAAVLRLLEVQQTARGARRLVRDLAYERSVIANDNSLALLGDLGRATRVIRLAPTAFDEQPWSSTVFREWFDANPERAKVGLARWGEEIDDDVARLREYIGHVVARRPRASVASP